MFQAAAAFPANVAACPQRTRAIVTKYNQNPSFIEWRHDNKVESFSPLEYENVNDYSAELFESYFQFKQLIKRIQGVISRPENYEVYDPSKAFKDPNDTKNPTPSSDSDKIGVPLDIATLVAVRSALRNEMAKIVAAVDVLTKDPGILKRMKTEQKEPQHDFVRKVLARVRGVASTSLPSNAPPESSNQSNTPANPVESAGSTITLRSLEQLSFDFSSLVAPEIWSEILPRRKADGIAAANGEVDSSKPFNTGAVLPPIIPAPSEEEEHRANTGAYLSPQDLAQLKAERDNHKKELENNKNEIAEWKAKYDNAIWLTVYKKPAFYDGPELTPMLAASVKNYAYRSETFRLSHLAGYPEGGAENEKVFNSLDSLDDNDRVTRLTFHISDDHLYGVTLAYAGRDDLRYGSTDQQYCERKYLDHNIEPPKGEPSPAYVFMSVNTYPRTSLEQRTIFCNFFCMDSRGNTLQFLPMEERKGETKSTLIMTPPAPGWVVKGVWGTYQQNGWINQLGFVWGQVRPKGPSSVVAWDESTKSVKSWNRVVAERVKDTP